MTGRGQVLRAAARDVGYPMGAFVFSLAACKLPRVIAFEGLASKDIVATRGVAAGSAAATFELMALLLPVIRNIRIKHPKRLCVCMWMKVRRR